MRGMRGGLVGRRWRGRGRELKGMTKEVRIEEKECRAICKTWLNCFTLAYNLSRFRRKVEVKGLREGKGEGGRRSERS